MLKMFATQLQGVFKKIEEKELINIEEGARLLSQALVGDGVIYIHGIGEMKAVEWTALFGPEPLQKASSLDKETNASEITSLDRVLLVSRYSTDVEALELAKELSEKNIPIVAISTIGNSDLESLHEIVDVHIDSHIVKGLLPDEEGGRFGIPSSLAGLYVYYGLYFTIQEIIAENE